MDRAAEEPGHALSYAHQRKMRQSHDDCNREGISFIPLPVETLGGWHSQAVEHITRQLARHTGREDEEVVRHLFQRAGYPPYERECGADPQQIARYYSARA